LLSSLSLTRSPHVSWTLSPRTAQQQDLGGTSDWDYGNYTYIDQHTYFVHLPSSNAQTPEHELAHGISLGVFKDALESLFKACSPNGWDSPHPAPVTKRNDSTASPVPPSPPSPGTNPRPLAGYKRCVSATPFLHIAPLAAKVPADNSQTVSSPIPPKRRRLDLSSPVPPSQVEEVYAEYGIGGLVEQEKSKAGEDDDDEGDWETVDEDWVSRYTEPGAKIDLGPDVGHRVDLESSPGLEVGMEPRAGTELEAKSEEQMNLHDDGDNNEADGILPAVYGYDRLDSDDSDEDDDASSDDFEWYAYNSDADNTPQVLRKLARLILIVKVVLGRYPELGSLPSLGEQPVIGDENDIPVGDDVSRDPLWAMHGHVDRGAEAKKGKARGLRIQGVREGEREAVEAIEEELGEKPAGVKLGQRSLNDREDFADWDSEPHADDPEDEAGEEVDLIRQEPLD